MLPDDFTPTSPTPPVPPAKPEIKELGVDAGQYAFGTLFRANPEQLSISHSALAQYRDWYGDADKEYPLRVVESRHTGFPALLNGKVDASMGHPIELAEKWFWQDERIGDLRVVALLGLQGGHAREQFRYAENDDRIMGERMGRPVFHIRYQQWFQNKFPVYGGVIVVHGSSELQRASVSSSYLPVPTQAFNPEIQVPQEKAIEIARQVMLDYVDGRDWIGSVARYFGQDAFVLPYVEDGIGKFALAYEIQFTREYGEAAWRVFVDAESGVVLGEPEDLMQRASVFGTSAEIETNQRMPLSPAELAGLTGSNTPTNRVAIFEFEYHSESTFNGPIDLTPPNVNAVLAGGDANRAARMQEALNIAWHAKRAYEHFIHVGVSPLTLSQYKRADGTLQPAPTVRIYVGRNGNPGDPIDVGYNPVQTLDPRVINFQSDNTRGGGLSSGINNKPIFQPSLDPEVVIHEITHALMWMVSPDPFLDSYKLTPFAAAVREGYANYFGHSIGARVAPVSDTWASGSYRQQHWGKQWALPSVNSFVGADLLAAPNLFPHAKTDSIDKYDVGMILARAFWDVRDLLGADLTDKLALNALTYAHGIVTNFEQLAEGFIDSASHDANAQAHVPQIIELFAKRRILAQRGIQSIAPVVATTGALDSLLVSDDFGVWRSLDGGVTWNGWQQPSNNPIAKGAISLAEQNQIVYAAAEDGIYQRARNAATWSSLGNWNQDTGSQRPMALVATATGIYVGTGRGVWRFGLNPAAANWESWYPNGGIRIVTVIDLVEMSRTSNNTIHLYANQFRSINYRGEGDPADWNSSGGMTSGGVAITPLLSALTAQHDVVYCGTLSQGIWKQTWNGGNLPSSWQQIVTSVQLGNAPVLCLALAKNKLWVGTMAGLKEIQLDTTPIQVTAIALRLNSLAPWITKILAIDNIVLVGTAQDGLWRREGQGAFQSVLNVGI